MGVWRRVGLLGMVAGWLMAVACAQTPAVDAGLSFEVATIRPSAPGEAARGLGWEGRHFSARFTTISQMVQFAYNLQQKQIVGAPEWLDTATYDIEAEAETGQPQAAEFRVMMQHLLAERFGMRAHGEQRTMSAYALVVAKGGAKLGAAKDEQGFTPGVRVMRGPHEWMRVMGVRATMPELAAELQRVETDRSVVDQTGLTGEFNFTMTATSEKPFFMGETPATDDDAPALIFTAIQEQLGLRLVPEKTAVPCLVLDHMERPSGN